MAKVSAADETTAPSQWQYFRVHLSDHELDAKTLTMAFERLHRVDPSLRLEWLLVTQGDRVEYYFGVEKTYRRSVEHIIRSLFPDETTVERSEYTPPTLDAETSPVGVAFHGRGIRRKDWQTRLAPVCDADDALQFPLSGLVDTLADTDSTVVYQTLIEPYRDWTADGDARTIDLRENRDTTGQRLFEFIAGDFEPRDSEDIDPQHRRRIEHIETADAQHAFAVNARAVVYGDDAQAVAKELTSTFAPVDGEFYKIAPRLRTGEAAEPIHEALIDRAFTTSHPYTARLKQRFPLTENTKPAIITDPETVANFCVVDGASLTSSGRRAMRATPQEQTGIPRPESELLAQYDSGLLLGYPLTDDDTAAETPISLPPSLQPLHTAWFGKTGSGKSTALINAMLENHEATGGADILIDPKGDGMAVEYLRAHYAKYGSLENVYYFDCTKTLPAISFFDIRDQLDDGVDRTTAVEDVVDHYVETLVGIMGRERFERAVRSPDIIKYLVKAMFDPVHGSNAFSHRELQDSLRRMHDTRDAPPVVDPDLEQMLGGVVANSKRSFHELMQGVANRIEKIPLDARLAQLFNHVPEEDDPQFDFRDVVDEDAVVLFDTGGLRPESQRALTLVLLSQLWTALRRRTQHSDDDHRLVNLYLEEAATVATSGLMTDLLAQSRSFGLSMTLAMQFPAQLRQADNEAYAELLNNVSTIVTGNVAVDSDLAKRLATEDMPPSEVANRLRALRRGQWFASLPSEFGTAEPRPFLLESAPLPGGHPESDEPLSAAKLTAFEAAFDVVRDRSRIDHGIDLALKTQQATMSRHARRETPSAEANVGAEPIETAPDVDTDARVDSALPYTKRLPEPVEYDAEKHALLCTNCESRYDPTSEGMRQTIRCCHTLGDVNRDDVPICEVNLNLSVDERRQSPYTDAQLRLLRAVYGAHQRRFDPEFEYNLLYDSMVRLQEYVGIEQPEVQELIEAGLLAQDCQYPHVLYTVTPEGRKAAKIQHREGVAYGDGQGDLSESSLHVAMVELGRQYIEQAFVGDEESDAVEAVSYHEVDGNRLDAAGLDENGDVVVAVEAERSNHDTLRAVPDDFDKMAAHEPEAAIWVVKNRDGAHDALDALNDPPEGEVRVERTYSRSSPPQQFNIDTPGMTDVFTFQYLRDSVLE